MFSGGETKEEMPGRRQVQPGVGGSPLLEYDMSSVQAFNGRRYSVNKEACMKISLPAYLAEGHLSAMDAHRLHMSRHHNSFFDLVDVMAPPAWISCPWPIQVSLRGSGVTSPIPT